MPGRIGTQEGVQRWGLRGDVVNGLDALQQTLGNEFEVAGLTTGSAVASTRSGAELPPVDGWTVTSAPLADPAATAE